VLCHAVLLQCPDGFVPLGPNSNLEPYYDTASASWSVRMKPSSAGAAKAAPGTASAPRPAPAQQQTADFFTQANEVLATSNSPPPWYPYECVPCPEGYSVDFYGMACGELILCHSE